MELVVLRMVVMLVCISSMDLSDAVEAARNFFRSGTGVLGRGCAGDVGGGGSRKASSLSFWTKSL